MVTAFRNHVHADMNRNPQYILEGDTLTTATLYGVTPANPDYIDIDIDGGRLIVTSAEERIERRQAGTMGRIAKTTHKERYTAQLIFNASNGNALLQQWCIDESLITDNTTASNSITILQSYNINGTETFEYIQGCHPTRCQITVGASGHIVYTVDLRCRTFVQSTTAPVVIGTGSYATQLTQAPWIASDGGVDHFDWNTVAEALNSMTITIDRQFGVSSPTEVIRDMFAQETIRNISGNIEVIVRNSSIITDAFTIPRVPRAMNIVLRSGTGGITIAFTNCTLENPSGRNPDPASAEPWMDNYAFEAETIAASINV